MTAPRSDTFVSVIAPVHNQAKWIAAFTHELANVLRAEYSNYEIILVDDGSHDGTAERLRELAGEVECLRIIQLSRNFGREAALLAGLDTAIGDYIVVMLPESDPPALVPAMVQKCRSGQGVVIGVESDAPPRSLPARLTSDFFHWYCQRYLGLRLYQGSRFFRVFSRAALNAVLQIRDRVRGLRYLSSIVGFNAELFPYTPVWRTGQPPAQPLTQDLATGLNIVLASSRHPMRLVSFLGLFASAVNLLYLGYVMAIYFFKNHVAEGWTTLSLQQGMMFFLLFAILTVMSEYIGMILAESQDRPAYFVANEIQSNVGLRNTQRHNVVTDSR